MCAPAHPPAGRFTAPGCAPGAAENGGIVLFHRKQIGYALWERLQGPDTNADIRITAFPRWNGAFRYKGKTLAAYDTAAYANPKAPALRAYGEAYGAFLRQSLENAAALFAAQGVTCSRLQNGGALVFSAAPRAFAALEPPTDGEWFFTLAPLPQKTAEQAGFNAAAAAPQTNGRRKKQ